MSLAGDAPHVSKPILIAFAIMDLIWYGSEPYFFFFFWLWHEACGIKPAPPALEVQSFNHWATREVPDPSIETHHWDPMNTNMKTAFLRQGSNNNEKIFLGKLFPRAPAIKLKPC